MARRKGRSRSRSGWVSFTTRRGRKVRFKPRPLGQRGRARRRTAWNGVFKRASAACRRKRGVRPFTKSFGKCMKAELRGGRRSGRSRSRSSGGRSRSRSRSPQQTRFAKAARSCRGKSAAQFRKCMKKKLKGRRGRR